MPEFDEDPDIAFRARRPGYYVIDIDARAGVRGPYRSWELAVRAGAELNAARVHARPLEVRVVGAPSPSPYDRERRGSV